MKKDFSNPFKALKNRNFFIYWLGFSISHSGTWMQNIAQPWLALIITNNPTLVGLVGAVQFLPTMLFSLFSGVFVDRLNKKLILYITQSGQCVVSLFFALSVFYDFATYALVLSLAFATGIFNCLDSPARHSFIYELVSDKKLVPNAVALNSMSLSVSRIAGPSLAGLVIATFGLGTCFLFNTFSFIAIFISLFFIHANKSKPKKHKESILRAIKSAFYYIKNNDILLTPLLILLIFATLIPNYAVNVSALVRFELGGNDGDFGYLMAFIGIGGFAGAFASAIQKEFSIKTIYYGPFVCAFWLFCVGIYSSFWWVAVMLTLTSFSFIRTLNAINSCLQLHSLDLYRGRVMSVYTLFGTMPFGAWIAGFLATEFGAKENFFICAIATCVLLILLYLFRNIVKK